MRSERLGECMDQLPAELGRHPMLWFSRSGLMEVDRRAVEQFGIPMVALMENAGRQVADITRSYTLEGSAVLILVGAGNNGGDGLVAARHLANRGHAVRIVLTTEESKFKGAAQRQLQIVRSMNLPVQVLPQHTQALSQWLEQSHTGDAIIDSMFGTGLNRPLDGLVRELILNLNAAGQRVVSVDLPSGLDCDTGKPLGAAVQAAHTVSFCGMKIGFESPEAIRYLGQISIGDIGAPLALLQACAERGGTAPSLCS
ncbi:MAG: NAD(P)H-hydrate epimerase [Phycisphaerae bacterium]